MDKSLRQPTLELTGIALAYGLAGLAVLAVASGLLGLPGVTWAKVLPCSVWLGALAGMSMGVGLIAIAVGLFRFHGWARNVAMGLQVAGGIILPLAYDPARFLPRVDPEFVIVARGMTALTSVIIVAFLCSRSMVRVFNEGGLMAEKRHFYCPLCLDRFDDPPSMCPHCDVPILQAVRSEAGGTYAVPVAKHG